MWIIVQARFNSERLHGKVLQKLDGKSMLQWTLERLSNCERATKIVLATSVEPTDDPIAEFCRELGFSCFRGNLENVAERIAKIVRQEKIESFVRISGDSPLIDSRIVDKAIQLFECSDCDLTTNILVRSFPKGQSVEVLKSETFLNVLSQLNQYEQEHVTPFYYQNPERFRITAFTSGVDAGNCQLSVDTLADFKKIKQLLKQSSGQPGNWRQLWEMSQKLE